MSEVENTDRSFENFMASSNYFSSTSVNIYIGGSEGICGSGEKMDFSYIQFAPQQSVVPVYNIFGTLPSLMLRGNSIVRGVIGLNFQLATYMTSIEEVSENYKTNLRYTGGISTKYTMPKVYDDYLIYVPHMRIDFINELALKPKDSEARIVVPTISMFDVYFSGGVISVAPDGSPVQDVYQYMARRQIRRDTFITINYEDPMEVITSG